MISWLLDAGYTVRDKVSHAIRHPQALASADSLSGAEQIAGIGSTPYSENHCSNIVSPPMNGGFANKITGFHEEQKGKKLK